MRELTLAEQSAVDQAAGLRRLFGNRSARSVSFVHTRRRPGSAMNVARTANALASHGHQVIIVDEYAGPDSVTAITGQTADFDLFDAFIGDCSLEDTFIKATAKITVVPAVRAAREFGVGEVDIEQRMAACLSELGVKAGFVLLDSGVRQGDVSQLARAADHLAFVTRAVGSSITDTYALIKTQRERAGRQLIQLVLEGTGAESSARDYRTIFQNIQATAHKHLDVNLNLLGTLDSDGVNDLADGLLTRLSPASPKHARGGNVVRLRGMFGPSGLFESVV